MLRAPFPEQDGHQKSEGSWRLVLGTSSRRRSEVVWSRAKWWWSRAHGRGTAERARGSWRLVLGTSYRPQEGTGVTPRPPWWRGTSRGSWRLVPGTSSRNRSRVVWVRVRRGGAAG